MPQIIRTTLFKLPNPDVLEQALQKYSTLKQDALKVSTVPTLRYAHPSSPPFSILQPLFSFPPPKVYQNIEIHILLDTQTHPSLLLPQEGKPYIHLASAIKLHPDARSQGFTLLARTVFASKADMDFYDDEDEAHRGIKALIKPCLGEMPLVVYGEGEGNGW